MVSQRSLLMAATVFLSWIGIAVVFSLYPLPLRETTEDDDERSVVDPEGKIIVGKLQRIRELREVTIVDLKDPNSRTNVSQEEFGDLLQLLKQLIPRTFVIGRFNEAFQLPVEFGIEVVAAEEKGQEFGLVFQSRWNCGQIEVFHPSGEYLVSLLWPDEEFRVAYRRMVHRIRPK